MKQNYNKYIYLLFWAFIGLTLLSCEGRSESLLTISSSEVQQLNNPTIEIYDITRYSAKVEIVFARPIAENFSLEYYPGYTIVSPFVNGSRTSFTFELTNLYPGHEYTFEFPEIQWYDHSVHVTYLFNDIKVQSAPIYFPPNCLAFRTLNY